MRMLSGRSQKKNRIRARSARLSMESLENRIVLACVVMNGNDGGAGSLRACLAAPGVPPDITFAAGVNTVTLTSGELNVTQSVNIDGAAAGAAKVTVQRDAAAAPFRIFSVNNGAASLINVTMNNLRIRNGDATQEANINTLNTKRGGGIDNTENLTITNSIITENFARRGGGVSHRAPDYVADPATRGGTLTINNTEITNNNAVYTDLGRGGAISSIFAGKMTITNSKLNGNSAGALGGAMETSVSVEVEMQNVEVKNNNTTAGRATLYHSQFGAAAGPATSVLMENCTVENNSATGGNIFGAVHVSQNAKLKLVGSSIRNNTGVFGLSAFVTLQNVDLQVETTTISGNANGGVSLNYYTGAGFYAGTALDMSSSTVSGNGGGAYYGYGVLAGNLVNSRIFNSTISGNSSYESGGGLEAYVGGTPTVTNPRLDIISTTITNNTARATGASGRGGGLSLLTALAGGSVQTVLKNTIVSGNQNPNPVGPAPDVYDYGAYYFGLPFVTGTFSLIGNNSGSGFVEGNPDANGNKVGGPVGGVINANLGALGNNGGPTLTHKPNAGSPAINTGDPAIAGVDQRGYTRPGGPRTDMGSVESDGNPPGINLDFNNDGQYNCGDMNLLETAIDGGVYNAAFDVNGDNVLSAQDVFAWLVDAGALRFGAGRSFKNGDANLDGTVDGSDFGIWNSNKFTPARNWCQGDFNQDNFVDGSDFGLWNANKFTSSDAGRPSGQNEFAPNGAAQRNGLSRLEARRLAKGAPMGFGDDVVSGNAAQSNSQVLAIASRAAEALGSLDRVAIDFGSAASQKASTGTIASVPQLNFAADRLNSQVSSLKAKAHDEAFKDLASLNGLFV